MFRRILPSFLFFAALLLPMSSWALGLLIPTNTSVRPFDLVSHRATVSITNTAATTTVVQVFKNHTNRPLEAQFVFPIPEGGTVSNFSLWINGKKTKGTVLEKNEARRIYESIVRRVEDPGLIEYMDGKLFRASIFPIPPHGTQKLEIQFGQILEKQGDMYRYVYPLSAGKQYIKAVTEKDFTIIGAFHSTVPIKTIYSPSHKIGVSRTSDLEAKFGAEEVHATLDRDFELYVSFSKKDIGISLMTHDPDGKGGEDGYFMMALSPNFEAKAHEEIGQTMTFVIDTSGSMDGAKMEQARKTLEYCISRLRPQDHFNIVRFSTDTEKLFSNPVKANTQHKQEALAFAKKLVASGGTAISEALQLTLKQKTPKYQPHQILFLTDGNPTVGETDVATILENVKKSTKNTTRIFSFGIGFSVNTNLLDAIATSTRGRPDYVKPDMDIKPVVAALYDRISAPVMTDLKIDFGKTRVFDVYPRPIPDLFRGDQIVLFGRYKKDFKGPIVVRGRVGRELKSYVFGGKKKTSSKSTKLSSSSSAPLEFIPKLWATRKVGFLLENIRVYGDKSHELKNEVMGLGKKFGLVTPYTSYLAVDDSEFAPRDELPNNNVSDRPTRRPLKTRGKRRAKNKKSHYLDSAINDEMFGGFDASSGEGAVKSSVKTRNLKESTKLEEERSSTRRYVASYTYFFKNGVWIQEGAKVKKAKKIKAYSKAFFKLMKTHPELKKVISKLGTSIVMKLGKSTYQITK